MKWRIPRIWLLAGVTAAAIVIAFPPTGGEGESATAVKNNPQPLRSLSSQPTSQQQLPQLGHVEIERLSQQKTEAGSGKTVSNAFNPTSWYVAPPRPPAPPPPPPPPPPIPTAPPLPFTYLGRYEDPPKLVVMLANGNKLYTVSEGEVIDGTYRVDRITHAAVDLVYLPLNINQSISTIGAPENTQNRVGTEEQNRRP